MIGVAIVGAGLMAREHARAFAALEGVEVRAIHSRTRSRAEQLASECGISIVADDVDGLRAQSQAQLVVVAVPELAANGVAKACLAHDWALLLEKPAGYDLDDALDIAAAAEAHSRLVFVGLNRRFYSSVRQVVTDLEARDGPRFIHVQDQQSFAESRQHGHPELVVEKFMYANSIHVIDLIRLFGRGDIVEVNPIMPWMGEDTDIVLVHMRFRSGDTALYEGIWRGPGPWACTVNTRSRRWTLKPLEQADYQDAGERMRHACPPDPIDSEYKAGFVLQARAVIDCLRGHETDAILLNQGVETMRLIRRMFGV